VGRKEEGGGGRKGEKGDRGKGAAPREKAGAGKEVDAGGVSGGGASGMSSLDTLASVASRVTLSSYHALVRASLRRALERGTWRSYACWMCAGAVIDKKGLNRFCPALRPAAVRATVLATRRELAAGVESSEGSKNPVLVAPPLFGSEAALRDHLAHGHGIELDYKSNAGIQKCLQRLPKEVLPAEPSEQMLDALLGVRGVGIRGEGAPILWQHARHVLSLPVFDQAFFRPSAR